MTDTQRVVLLCTNNDVVSQIDADDFGRFVQLSRQREIGGAWRRIARGVRMLCEEPSYVE